VLSPSRELHMRNHVRTSHHYGERDMEWYNVPKRERPNGGYGLEHLLVGRLPDMSAHRGPQHGGRHDRDGQHTGFVQHRDEEADRRYFQESMAMRREHQKPRQRGFSEAPPVAAASSHRHHRHHADDYTDVERFDRPARASSRRSSRHSEYADADDYDHRGARRSQRAPSRGASHRHEDAAYTGGRRQHDSYSTTYTTRARQL